MSRLVTIAEGDSSHVTQPRRDIVHTDAEWRALWAAHAGPGGEAPAVDLSAVTIAAAFAGEKPSAGHAIEITDVPRRGPAGVTLAVEQRAPARDMVAAAIITSPFHIVAVPNGAGDVSWQETGGSGTSGLPSSTLDPRSTIDPAPSSTGLEPRTAAALAYLAGPFSGVLILLAESTNRDVRFHAWQSIIGLGGLGLAVAASYVLAFVALFVSATATLLMVWVANVIWIILALVWAICVWKAWSGARWKLPFAGDYAERFVETNSK